MVKRGVKMRKKIHKKKHIKGIIGIEAAIVLIAFVIVAAALSFVVLNMGMFTTQKSKEVIGRGLSEASSALEVDGSVLALIDNDRKVDVISVPVKLSPGREVVDFNVSNVKLLVTVDDSGKSYENILNGIYYLYWNDAVKRYQLINVSDGKAINLTTSPPDLSEIAKALGRPATTTVAYVVFIRSIDGEQADTVLEFGEKAVVIVLLSPNDRMDSYDQFTIEIRPIEGAPLTVERTIPPTLTANSAVTLG